MLAEVTSNPILLIVLFVAQLGLVVAISAGVNRMSTGVARSAVPRLLGAERVHLLARLRAVHGRVDLHHVPGGRLAVRGPGAVRRDHQARPDRARADPVRRADRADRGHGRERVRGRQHALLDHHVRGRADLRRADRVRHEQAAEVRAERRRDRRGPGRAGALPRLHQPVPLPAAHLRTLPQNRYEPTGPDGRRADLSRRARVRHLLPAAERAHRVPRHAGHRRDRQPDRRPAAAPASPRIPTRTSRSTSTRPAAPSTRASRSTTRCSSSSPTCRRSASASRCRWARCCCPAARRASGWRCPTRRS